MDALIGIKSCGCVVAAVVDSPDHMIDTANTVAGWGRSGFTVRRVTVEEARLLIKPCVHKKTKTAKKERSK